MQLMQACRQYYYMLQMVYGSSQVLDPYVMNVDALKEYSTNGTLLSRHPCPTPE